MLAIGSGGQHWVSRTTLKNVCWREVSTKENVFVLPSLVAGDGLVRYACQILHLWRHLVILRCWGLRVLRVHFRRPTFCRSSCSSSCGWGFQYGYTGLTYVTATVRGAELLHCVQKLKMRQPTHNLHARFLPQIVPLGAVP